MAKVEMNQKAREEKAKEKKNESPKGQREGKAESFGCTEGSRGYDSYEYSKISVIPADVRALHLRSIGFSNLSHFRASLWNRSHLGKIGNHCYLLAKMALKCDAE